MLNTSSSRFRFMGSRYSIGIAVCIVAALLALPLFIGSAVSPIRPIDNENTVQSAALANSHGSVPASSFNFLNPLPQAAPLTLDTFTNGCSAQKSLFNIQDNDKTVCAKFTNALPGWRVIWSNARGVAVQTNTITAANASATTTTGSSTNAAAAAEEANKSQSVQRKALGLTRYLGSAATANKQKRRNI